MMSTFLEYKKKYIIYKVRGKFAYRERSCAFHFLEIFHLVEIRSVYE